ncbi:MAG: MarR family transcriptional regulator [Lachnospiraceae bacterium]|nr:MarR family transcriptional regulator [Lachnospiraceae bacterium]
MNLDQTLNTLLVSLFNDILDIEEKSLITEEFKDITVNDMHVIEAIGREEPQASSVVARRLDITMGTLTKAIDGLNDKGYVNRVRSEQDKRVVLLSLTEKGMAAFHHHAMFHRDMIQALISQIDQEEKEILMKTLENLMNFLKNI